MKIGVAWVAFISVFLCALAGQAQAAIYWGDGTPIGRANLDGTYQAFEFIPLAPLPPASAVTDCGGVAVDPTHVFWADPASGTIGRANLDGTAPEYTFITGADNPCGVAVDGTSFAPPPPVLPSQFSYGKVRHNKGKGIAFVPVDFPDAGFLRVIASAGVKWSGLPGDKTGGSLASGGQQSLKVWAGGRGGNGRRLRQTLKRRGRARVGVEIEYTANGQSPSLKGKQLSLVLKR